MKVMLLYANAGNGHRRAAEALQVVCEADERFSEVLLVDVLHYTNKVFQELYANLYIEAVKTAPAIWSWAFDETDQPWRRDRGRLRMQRLNSQPLKKKILNFDPDMCICTHFMPADIIAHLIDRDRFSCHLSVVVTDYYAHATWLCPYVSRYFVAKEEIREQLNSIGYPAERISMSGIPVDPVFSRERDVTALRKKHDVNPELPLVLLSAGAFGVMSGDDLMRILCGIDVPCELVVVCGRNEKLKKQVNARVEDLKGSRVKFHILGFTTEMDEWMAMASLYVGKPGGLTTSECLACSLPMVIWEPIPGQEVYNTNYLLENGVAIVPDSARTLSYRINELLKNPQALERMSAAASSIAHADAARVIVDEVLARRSEGVIKIRKDKSV